MTLKRFFFKRDPIEAAPVSSEGESESAAGEARWRFRRMIPSEINQDPVQGEFFTSASDLSERFVRESLQNSLDARRGSERVLVRFTFSDDSDALSSLVAARYLNGLGPHLVCDPGADDAEQDAVAQARACLDEPMTWVTVEDFGTSGLVGDIEANNPKEPGNHFWGFFRSIGISPKGEDSGGSWGLGKWVFPDASMINAYLGATQRVDEDRVLLMGMAVLKTHSIDGAKHPPYGQFAAATDTRDDEWLPLPIDSRGEPGVVDHALTDFGLYRRDQPGLSVIVPYPKKELTPEAVARTVITQFFLPIVRGDLTVEIGAPGLRKRIISSDTIAQEVAYIPTASSEEAHDEESPDSLARVIRLAQWAVEVDQGAHIKLPVPTRSNDTLDSLDLVNLRELYERGERLAFEFETRVQRRGSSHRTATSFQLYAERAEELSSGHDYFVRGHLSIPRMDYITRYKARVLVTVDGESELAHLLRDSEGPAHILWDPREQRLKDNWIGGFNRVQEVRRAAVLLLQRLVERPDERQYDALADLFPADPANIRGRTPSGRRGGSMSSPNPPPRPVAPLNVRRTESGFSLVASQGQDLVGSEWTLRFAYDVVRGNAFSVFERGVRQGTPDFSIGPGQVELHQRSADVEHLGENAVRFLVLSSDVRLDVRGLDGRDVIVDLQRVEATDDSNGADNSL